MSTNQNQMSSASYEKVNQELLSRIAQITASYEGQLINIKVQAEEIIEDLQNKITELEGQAPPVITTAPPVKSAARSKV